MKSKPPWCREHCDGEYRVSDDRDGGSEVFDECDVGDKFELQLCKSGRL